METIESLKAKIGTVPRVKLINLPTPLQEMPRLTKLLNGPKLWIKRDDSTGLAFGGNKERKAEFAIGDALSKNADVVITVGPVQSNHARATAAAARKAGLKVVLVLSGEKPQSYDGNLLLDYLLGAEVRFLSGRPSKLDRTRCMEEVADDLKKKGHVPYLIPAGASYPPGVTAYVNAMLELFVQAQNAGFRINHVVHAAGSGGTQAGLVLANKALGSKAHVIGICVEPDIKDHLAEETIGITSETAKRLNIEVAVNPDDVVLNEDYTGEAYGRLTPEALDAIRMVAETEGILLDPVYTGKAMAGLIHMIKKNSFKKGDNVVFIHTGGVPALFAYKKELYST